MYKIWHKFFLLAVLSFMPLVSQALCTTPSGFGTGTFTQQPYPGGVKLFLRTSVTLSGTLTCFISPTPLTTLGKQNNLPKVFKSNGVTVDLEKVKVFVDSNLINCNAQRTGTSEVVLVSQLGFTGCAGQTINLRFEYLLEGTSTTSADVVLFTPQISSVEDTQNPLTTATKSFDVVKVPKSNAPTCSTSIPASVNLNPLSLSEAKSALFLDRISTNAKRFDITLTCPQPTIAFTVVPTFTFKTVGLFNTLISPSVGQETGMGFRLSNTLTRGNVKSENVASGVPHLLSPFVFSASPTPNLQSVTQEFELSYVNVGGATTSGKIQANIIATFTLK